MKKHSYPDHAAQIVSLRRIEGQIRGIQKMIEDKRYCVDVLIQLRSVVKAIGSVREKILRRHLEHCVKDALQGKSEAERQKKIDEVINLLSRHNGD
ncbi:MAG: metal-sensitive transcriptional regulator [Candidatus Omnitrophota bacterium]